MKGFGHLSQGGAKESDTERIHCGRQLTKLEEYLRPVWERNAARRLLWAEHRRAVILKLKRRLIIVWVVLLMISLSILYTYLLTELYFLNSTSVDNAMLPFIGRSFSPPAKSIYFHETSSDGGLTSRQACAVESAAIAHPGWQINVFFIGPVTKEQLNEGGLKVLMEYDNIRLLRLNIVDYALGTPIEKLVRNGALNRSKWVSSHTSDALRYLSLYKWGGVYLDLDMVVARSFEDLSSNWAARESVYAVAAGAISFSNDMLGRSVAEIAIRNFNNTFNGDEWANNGPGVITRVLLKVCGINIITEMSGQTCKGFEVYRPEYFYPVNWLNYTHYFNNKELNVDKPYTYHVWNKDTQYLRVCKKSVYARLAQKYCPKVYRTYEENFGL